jgi:hypothetical protein
MASLRVTEAALLGSSGRFTPFGATDRRVLTSLSGQGISRPRISPPGFAAILRSATVASQEYDPSDMSARINAAPSGGHASLQVLSGIVLNSLCKVETLGEDVARTHTRVTRIVRSQRVRREAELAGSRPARLTSLSNPAAAVGLCAVAPTRWRSRTTLAEPLPAYSLRMVTAHPSNPTPRGCVTCERSSGCESPWRGNGYRQITPAAPEVSVASGRPAPPCRFCNFPGSPIRSARQLPRFRCTPAGSRQPANHPPVGRRSDS